MPRAQKVIMQVEPCGKPRKQTQPMVLADGQQPSLLAATMTWEFNAADIPRVHLQ